MSIFHDMLGRPTPGEQELRTSAAQAQLHAEALEEKLLVVDAREFTDTAVHAKVCFERQVAAQAWRRASALQSRLNGAENRRYARAQAAWSLAGFVVLYLQMNGVKLQSLGDLVGLVVKALGAT